MKRQPDTILDYTRQLANLIGLGHWRIDFDVDPAPDDAVAAIRVIRGQQRAMLQIGKQYASQSLEDQRSTILHELVHVYLWPVDDLIGAVQPHLGTAAAAIVEAQHELAIERATDALAVAVAPFFPLPKKVEP